MQLLEQAGTLRGKLDAELKRFAPGNRFYSVRQLISRYEVSQRVVNAALAQLEADGMVEKRFRQGIYVRRSSTRRRIALFMPDWPSESNQIFLRLIRDEFRKYGETYEFTSHLYDHEEDFIAQIERVVAHCVILLWPGRAITRPELIRLAGLDKMLVMRHELAPVSIHSIGGGSEYGATIAAAHFIRRGHRKLAILISEPLNIDVKNRVTSFSNAIRLFGGEAEIIDCRVHSGEYSQTAAHDCLLAHLEHHGCRFTGIFCMSTESSQGAMAALTEFGLTIPGDISVIGYGYSQYADYYTPPLTTVSGRIQETAAEAVRAIHRHLENPGDPEIIDITIPPVITERASVRDLHATGKPKEPRHEKV